MRNEDGSRPGVPKKTRTGKSTRRTEEREREAEEEEGEGEAAAKGQGREWACT